YCTGAAVVTSRATRIFRSPRSTSISVRSVSFRMSASERTRAVSISSFLSLGADVLGSAMGASSCLLNRTVGGGTLFLRQPKGGLDRQFVAERAEARNHAGCGRRHIGAVAEAFPRRRIGQVALDDGDRQGPEGVQQGHRGVAIAGGIEDQG